MNDPFMTSDEVKESFTSSRALRRSRSFPGILNDSFRAPEDAVGEFRLSRCAAGVVSEKEG